MRYLHVALAALFGIVAYLQLNDPDPLYWVVVYLSAATITFARGLGVNSRLWTAVVIGGVGAGMLGALPGTLDYLASGQWSSIFGDMRGPAYVEPAREFLGLTLVFAVLAGYIRR